MNAAFFMLNTFNHLYPTLLSHFSFLIPIDIGAPIS